MSRRNGTFAAALLALLAPGCAADADDESGQTEAAASETLDVLYADVSKTKADRLASIAVGFASEALNDKVGAAVLQATLERDVYATDAAAKLPDGTEVKALKNLVEKLEGRFGATELAVEANKARLAHLGEGADRYYVESSFDLAKEFDHGWRFDSPGFTDGYVRVGFGIGTGVSSRIVLAVPQAKIGDAVKAPLAAAKEMHGFVVPRSLEDVVSMKPGELIALRGTGTIGGTFGLGAPLLVTSPVSGVGYSVVVSAGVSGLIDGAVDVQLLKLAGNEVVVDVGVENGRARELHAQLGDHWGVKGICNDGAPNEGPCLRPLRIGGATLDLARVVEKAMEKRLNRYTAFEVGASSEKKSSRVSLSRVRFHLDRGDRSEVSRALEHALRLDLRLAQALAVRDLGDPAAAVVAELDAVRASTTSTRSFGFELFGMNIYRRMVESKEGTFVLQTPDGVRTILFDTTNKHVGKFQRDHGAARTGIAAQTIDAANPDSFRSEANLWLQVAASDQHMDDELLVDDADGVLTTVGGAALAKALDAAKTIDDVEPVLATFPKDWQEVLRAAARVRIASKAIGIPRGPTASLTVDVRLDDRALALLTSRSRAEYENALYDYLATITVKRSDLASPDGRATFRQSLPRDERRAALVAKMGAHFQALAAAYRDVADAEAKLPRALAGKRWVQYPLGVRFAISPGSAIDYESAILGSTSQERAAAATNLFDGLTADAVGAGVPLWEEHTAAMPLLALVPKENLELGIDIVFEGTNDAQRNAGYASAKARAKGANVSTISAGMFDLEAILAGK